MSLQGSDFTGADFSNAVVDRVSFEAANLKVQQGTEYYSIAFYRVCMS